jgi:hypothetical protein
MATLLANRHLRLARASAIARCRTTGCSSPAREFSSRCRLYNRHRPYLSNFPTTETAILTDDRHPETDHNEYIPHWIDNLPRPTVAGPHCRGPLSEFIVTIQVYHVYLLCTTDHGNPKYVHIHAIRGSRTSPSQSRWHPQPFPCQRAHRTVPITLEVITTHEPCTSRHLEPTPHACPSVTTLANCCGCGLGWGRELPGPESRRRQRKGEDSKRNGKREKEDVESLRPGV